MHAYAHEFDRQYAQINMMMIMQQVLPSLELKLLLLFLMLSTFLPYEERLLSSLDS